jgi:3-hydroxyacyl-CoA dehydrogenase
MKYVEAGWVGKKSSRGFYDYRAPPPVPMRWLLRFGAVECLAMRILRHGDDEFHLVVSRDELCGINNCLNETLSELADWEFQTRVGLERHEIRGLLEAIGRALGPGAQLR